MLIYVIFHLSISLLWISFQFFVSKIFGISFDIFSVLLVIFSLGLSFRFVILWSILLGLLMDYFSGLPTGFFVFCYSLTAYTIFICRDYFLSKLLASFLFFFLSKILTWLIACFFFGIVDLRAFNYSFFTLDFFCNFFVILIFFYFFRSFTNFLIIGQNKD